MRGKEVKTLLNFNRVGITPACAGKRCAVPRLRFAVRDYPRVCGEKAILYTREAALTGSPPRMRGKAFHRFWHHRGQGITPAYAGKRPTQRHGRRYSRDHPRVCGEKNGICRAKVPHLGSPPRMRGKAHDGRQVLRGLRRHLKCDWDGHLRLVQVGNVVHERALMPDVHESQSRRTPQRHNDRMGQPVQAGMYGGSHGCRGRAAAPKCLAHHPWLLPPCRMVIRPRP